MVPVVDLTFDNLDALDTPQLRATLGAMLIGGFICIFLSGIVTMQAYLYFRVYQKDAMRFKMTVTGLWLLDLLHSCMVCFTAWTYMVENFGNAGEASNISWSVAFSIAITAFVTLIVHLFFTHRLYTISKSNLWLVIPMAILAILRVAVALVTTAKMIQLKTYETFIGQVDWVFTMGLGISAVMDILIAGGLSYYLRKNKSGFSTMDQIIDSLVLYTVESGLITCITTIVSLVCWTTMSDNLIFLGLHFTISKLYANSLLATLNSRKSLKFRSQQSSDKAAGDHALPVLFPSRSRRRFSLSRNEVNPLSTIGVEINVQKTIRHEVDGQSIEVPLDDDSQQRSRDIKTSPEI